MKLTDKQISVLAILASRSGREEVDGPLSGPEIGAIQFRHSRSKTGSREWAAPALGQLEAKGLVEQLGKNLGNARCWKINAAGLDAYKTATAKGATD